MCQQDFDFGLVRSVGKMERRRESCNGSSRSSDDDYRHHQQTHSFSKGGSSSNNNMISPSLEEKNSLEDGSQGSEISGLDHQLPSMEKLEISGVGKCKRNSTVPDTASSPARCLSCSRRRRDDYGGNDFGECHQHQLLLMKQQTGKKNRVDRAFSSNKSAGSDFNSTYHVTEIDTASDLSRCYTTSSSSQSFADKSIGAPTSSFQEITSKADIKRDRHIHLFCGVSRAIWIQLGMLISLSVMLQGAAAVRINSLSVPHIIKNGTEESVILDCDYSIEDHEKSGLVVKWYFSNKQTQVYQWIPNSKPISLGILKGKLNLDYQADVDNYKMKRALQIIRPTTELSGNWICHVSTFDGDAMEAASMIVYAPEKEMEIKVMENRRGNFVNISCWATRVFPKPKIAFYFEEQELPDVMVRFDEYEGAYDIRAYKVIEEATLSSMIGSVFECELAIPKTNYLRRKTMVFEPGSLELKDAMRMSLATPLMTTTMISLFIPFAITIIGMIL